MSSSEESDSSDEDESSDELDAVVDDMKSTYLGGDKGMRTLAILSASGNFKEPP